jgi:hypothetical protein
MLAGPAVYLWVLTGATDLFFLALGVHIGFYLLDDNYVYNGDFFCLSVFLGALYFFSLANCV